MVYNGWLCCSCCTPAAAAAAGDRGAPSSAAAAAADVTQDGGGVQSGGRTQICKYVFVCICVSSALIGRSRISPPRFRFL